MKKTNLPISYRIYDIEVTQSLQTLETGHQHTGIALVLRKNGEPLGFIMKPMDAGGKLTPEQIRRLATQKGIAIPISESIHKAWDHKPLPQKYPSLTVAICTRNHPERLKRCLESLCHIQSPHGFPQNTMEVLVVDNAPSDDKTRLTAASLSGSFSGLRYIREEKPGLDFARNRALLEASGEIVAYLDDDVVTDAGWLKGLLEAFGENPDAGGFTGLVLPYALSTRAQILFEQRGGFRRGFNKIRYGQTLPNNPQYPCGSGIFGAGCNMAFRKNALLALGGFDEALDTGPPLPGGGDLDMFYRIIRAGYPLVYEPRFMVFHEHRRTFDELRHQYFTWGQGFMAFVWKSHQQDKMMRGRFRHLVYWWFMDQVKRLMKSFIQPLKLPPTLVLAELWGGVMGLSGEYPRSLIRTREQHGSAR